MIYLKEDFEEMMFLKESVVRIIANTEEKDIESKIQMIKQRLKDSEKITTEKLETLDDLISWEISTLKSAKESYDQIVKNNELEMFQNKVNIIRGKING